MNDQFTILVRTYAGLEEVLAAEVRKLGGADVEEITRGITCIGDLGFLYKLNLGLRTGLRVLKPVTTFRFRNKEDFFSQVMEIDWHRLFSVDKTMTIDTLLFSEQFNNSMYVSQLTKDAICDRFRKETNKRPFIDSNTPQIYISVYVRDNETTIYLDSSGESLHKRGYRKQQVQAPLSEVMAAGILQISGWTHHFPLLDPMCGSGTFSIEAALMANNIPPGIFRPGFSFEHWIEHDPELFQTILTSLTSKITDFPLDIRASDRSRVALQIATENVKEADLEGDIVIEHRPIEKSVNPGKKAFIFMNPPYGERLQTDEIEKLYGLIGSTLKHTFMGCEAWLFTSNEEALKHIGLRPSRRFKLFNGPLECRLIKYELYPGTKKVHKEKPEKSDGEDDS